MPHWTMPTFQLTQIRVTSHKFCEGALVLAYDDAIGAGSGSVEVPKRTFTHHEANAMRHLPSHY